VFVRQAFESNWIAPLGPNVDGFEADLAAYTGAEHVAALVSGTAAIHLALMLLDVHQGDFVICQSFTFSATANPICVSGATPVFVDSEPETWNMCPELLEQAIVACVEGRVKVRMGKEFREVPGGRLPKAIIPVHLYGMPARMDEIMAVAGKYGIPVVEDAAESLGSLYKGRHTGVFGRMGVLSFNGNKIITTSGGGALLSDDRALIERARFLATQARDPAPHYQHSEIGYNYRMSNILAGVGRGQLQVLDERVKRRREVFDFYRELLEGLPGFSFLPEPDGSFSTRWLSTVLVDPHLTGGVTRETIRKALEKENIESRPLWKPLHLQPVFKRYPMFLNGVSEGLFDKGLCLPSGTGMTEDDMERIAGVLKGLVF